MNDNASDAEFEASLRAGLGSAETPDFDAWAARHAEAVAHLNPVVTELKRRKRKLLMRMTTAVVAAAACLVTLRFFIPEKASFADAVKRMDNAKTMTWTVKTYNREQSMDGKRTWLRVLRRTFAYREPGLYRMTDYDEARNPTYITIADARSGKTLGLDLREKKSFDWQSLLSVRFHARGPFGWVADAMEKQPLQFVGQRKVKDKTVNVFRFHPDTMPTGTSVDVWLNPQSKEVVGVCSPGADTFDPETMPDRNNAREEKFSGGTLLGSISEDFVYDATVDPEQFRMTTPPGFEIVPKPHLTVSEPELIEWLGATARVNKDVFPASLKPRGSYEPTRWSEIATRKRVDRTEAERKMYDLCIKYSFKNSGDRDRDLPVSRFIDDNTVAGSFRYVGVGVNLGGADRIVCWYKLKTTDKYRAVFGDLTVRDVAPEDLPLPVDH
jgi:hypothetical protein